MVLTHSQSWSKRLSRNSQDCLLFLLIMIFFFCFFIHNCDASRASSRSSVLYKNPNNDNKNIMRGHFLGFLPRSHFPVPVSAPSRKHNDIGLQAFLSP
ncbi:unnamed protein product [Cochlearia groenlandica]